MTAPVAYTAVIAPVREVILSGTAEPGYWRERLRSEDRDSVTIRPEAAAPVFRWLAESGFKGREWGLRGDAIHSRSKTYRRT
jgi:hypothetical protein